MEPDEKTRSAAPQHTIIEARSYRCFYAPKDSFGAPLVADSGVLPFIQVRAASAEAAQRAAHHLTGCAVSNVERLEEVAA